eukprot:EG_transcript_85
MASDWKLDLALQLSDDLCADLELCKSILELTGYDQNAAADLLLDDLGVVPPTPSPAVSTPVSAPKAPAPPMPAPGSVPKPPATPMLGRVPKVTTTPVPISAPRPPATPAPESAPKVKKEPKPVPPSVPKPPTTPIPTSVSKPPTAPTPPSGAHSTASPGVPQDRVRGHLSSQAKGGPPPPPAEAAEEVRRCTRPQQSQNIKEMLMHVPCACCPAATGTRPATAQLSGPSADQSSPGVICRKCWLWIVGLPDVSLVQNRCIGRALVVGLDKVPGYVSMNHHGATKKTAFRRGKLYCPQCWDDLGNVQNNVQNIGHARDCGLLNFATILFQVDGHLQPLTLTADQLAAAAGPTPQVRPLTPQLITAAAAVGSPAGGGPMAQGDQPGPSPEPSSPASTTPSSSSPNGTDEPSTPGPADTADPAIGQQTAGERGSRQRASNGRTPGRVVRVLEDHGFIRPEDGTADIIFNFDRVVHAGGLPLCRGDEVEVELSQRGGRPRAERVSATRLKRRTVAELDAFLDDLDLCDGPTVLSLTSARPFWVMVAMAPDIRQAGAELLSDLCGACDSGQLRGALPELMDVGAPLIAEVEDPQYLYQLLQTAATHRPSCMARLLPKVRRLIEADEPEDGRSLALDVAQLLAMACAGGDISNLRWQQVPLLPTPTEMAGPLHPPDGLPHARREGGYRDLEELLETIFVLEREDCFFPLRSAVHDLQTGTVSRDTKFLSFFTAKLVGVVVADSFQLNGFFAVLQLKQHGKRRAKKGLMFGSLLCLSLDNQFRSLVFATVAHQDGEKVFVELCDEDNAAQALVGMQAAGQMMALESPVYYRAHEPVMRVLQRMKITAFADELRSGGARVPSPRPQSLPLNARCPPEAFEAVGHPSTAGNCMADLCRQVTAAATMAHSQPLKCGSRTLDTTQAQAVAHVLTNRMALIQGPPGTGKSTVGVLLVKLLRHLYPEPRILIVSYKNHILNEMLTALLSEGVVRIGGGKTDNEALDARNLSALLREQRGRGATERSAELVTMSRDTEKRLKEAAQVLRDSLKQVNTALEFRVDTVLQYANDDQLDSLLSSSHASWTAGDRKAVTAARRALQPGIPLRDCVERDPKLRGFLDQAINLWLPAQEMANARKAEAGSSLTDLLSFPAPPISTQSAEEDDEDDDALRREEEERRQAAGDRKPPSLQVDIQPFERSGGPRCGSFALMERLGVAEAAMLQATPDVWQLTGPHRALLAHALLKRQQRAAHDRLAEAQAAFAAVLKERERLEEEFRLQVLAQCPIVGMTLDGHAIHADLIERWGPQVVIVEEAGECPIAKLLACLHPSVEHCVQIGDPKQLPPQVNAHHLTRHNFGVSMMEWLMTGLPSVTLGRQGRMRPEMRELLMDIYPALQDNLPVVKALVPAPCVQHSVFWWSHKHLFAQDNGSYRNVEEAHMVGQLVRHLLVQGVGPEKVTVLAAYRRQVQQIRRDLQQLPDFVTGPIDVRTIDEFQGKENDVVVVSLVGPTRAGHLCGFLANAEGVQRRCVAQSRARCSLFFVADHRPFAECKHWKFLINKLLEGPDCRLSDRLPLVCPRHPQFKRFVATAADVPVESALCGQSCGQPMLCRQPGHQCPRPCHGGDDVHKASSCRQFVAYCCPAGHAQRRRCNAQEEPCKVRVEHLCARGHPVGRLCSEAPNAVRCKTVVNRPCPKGHPLAVECHQLDHPDAIPGCTVKCTQALPCGDPCPLTCSEPCLDPIRCEPCIRRRDLEAQRVRQAALDEYALKLKRIEEELRALQEKGGQTGSSQQELVNDGDTAAEYFDVSDRVLKYVQPGHHWYPRITHIHRVHNPKLLKQFYEVAKELEEPSHTQLKFHGCDETAAKSIMRDGFRLPNHSNNMYGKGVYFASDSSKSAQEVYTKGSNMLLLCDVLLGKSWTVLSGDGMKNVTRKEVQAKGYDSVFAPRGTRATGGVLHDEFVVYDARQAVVKYVVHYETLETSSLCLLPTSSSSHEVHKIKPSRAYDPNNQLDRHFRIAEGAFQRYHPKGQVTQVEYHLAPALLQRFEAKKKQLAASGKGDAILAFHGTRLRASIDSIVHNNFDPQLVGSATGCVHGLGFYFSEFPDISLGYGQHLLLCQVLVGKEYDEQPRDNFNGKPLKAGYNSHRVQANAAGCAAMVIVADPDQILPLYVLHVQ